ncbi:MAG TPA: translation initiation factor IF-2 [Stellaceae bacterium]|jgi:translation initiation factor IF-2|nr:translation initiation factor IF-2 [Stellaceae bacterium]
MTDNNEQESKRPLSLGRPGGGRLELRKPIETGQVRQSFPHGRSKTVQVEVRRKRAVTPGQPEKPETQQPGAKSAAGGAGAGIQGPAGAKRAPIVLPRGLTPSEQAARQRALKGAILADEEARKQAVLDADRHREEEELRLEEDRRRREDDARRRQEEEEAKRKTEEEAKQRVEAEGKRKAEEDKRREMAERAGKAAAAKVAALSAAGKVKIEEEPEDEPKRGKTEARKPTLVPRRDEPRRRTGKLTVSRVLSQGDEERMRSLASVRRAREKQRAHQLQALQEPTKIVRDVVVPETITVQELANRMAERGTDVIKALMRMGVMATINQVIDADTAELVVTEFGHKLKRVAESDIELGLKGEADAAETQQPRPPVVTIMGHVDHGKTSLLDALRHTDVAAGEAGGITQHIGAYQVTLASGEKITFIDTPGHQAFTQMRARGATVTDIVVLVVAADDGIKEQTVEAIRHAKAAKVPIIVAINKVDKPDANPDKVRQELLQHEIVVEKMSGDVLDVEVSALKKTGLDKLEEAILLQAEILDLKSNPDRPAEGVVIEAKLERGRGAVATVLIKRGTLKVGDIFVTGSEWGRVRALLDDRGATIDSADPAMPVEVQGLNGVPLAGDDFTVAADEGQARDIAAFRQRRRREQQAAQGARGTLEQMFSQIAAGAAKELAVVVKSDVQGSLEAIVGSLEKLSGEEVKLRVLHSAVGGINESDVILAKASAAVIVGFNVRANPQARDMARRDGVEIRYYSIIYDVIDDMKKALGGMMAPTLRERFLGNATIREVFTMSKAGKVAGCMVTEGSVRRGARVRLLRDNVVVHEGSLKTLKRFKDEVREVKEGYECGMAFENYQDIQVGDVIECFEMEEVARATA